jgi:phospholipid/cholesterol/gamma-HCH transport system substrate-binding protein
LPSQQQLKWSQLRVGLTVLLASIALAVLIFLMSGTTGLFTPKLTLKAYFDNAGGLRVGAPVRLQGVDIGNVKAVRVTAHPPNPETPIEVVLKVTSKYGFDLRKDSVASLSTAGVLGETFIDIDSSHAKGPPVRDGDTLQIHERPDFQDVVRASQSTLQNLDALIRRMDRIIAFVESGNGSIGKLIYDPALFNKLNDTVSELQTVANEISSGKGSIGKLINSDEVYNKANTAIDNVNKIIDEINQGQGTVGKFLKDPTLYNNANATIAKANQLMEDVNNGKGALGLLAKNQEFADKVNTTMTKLSQISARLEAGEGSAGMLLRNPSLYNNTDQMLVETRNLIKAIRENPKKYLTIRFRVF